MVPEGWKISSLADIASISSGGTPSRKKTEYWQPATVPWVRTTEVQNCVLMRQDIQESISELGLNKSSAKLVPPGTVLLAMIGQGKTRGQVAFLTFEATTNQNCASIIFNKDQEPKFHYNFLLSIYEKIRQLSNSAGQSNLSGALVKSIRVPVPPLNEQKKIAQILSTWDKAITTTEQLLANSQQQKKALMQQLLTGKKRLLDENGVRFSGEWKKCRVDEYFDVRSSKRVLQKDWQDHGIPFYRTRELVSLTKNEPFSSEIFISKHMFEDLAKKYGVPKAGDFLVSGVGTLGISYQVKPSDKFYFKDGNVLWFKQKQGIHSDFFKYSFQSNFIQSQIKSQASITTVGTYTIQNARSTLFICPPSLNEQRKVALALTNIDQ